jgi:hypothetical protein
VLLDMDDENAKCYALRMDTQSYTGCISTGRLLEGEGRGGRYDEEEQSPARRMQQPRCMQGRGPA